MDAMTEYQHPTSGPAPEPGPTQPGPHGPQPQPGPYGPHPQPGGYVPPRVDGTEAFFDSVRRSGLVRTEDRWVGGVAGGVARRFGWDPLLARGLFVVAGFFGVGLLLYGVAWALLPEERDGRIHFQQLMRGNVEAGALGSLVLTLFGLGGPFWSPATWWGGGFGWFVVVAVTAATVLLVVALFRQDTVRPTPPAPGPGPAPTPGPAPAFTSPAPGTSSAPGTSPAPNGGTMHPTPVTPDDTPAPGTTPTTAPYPTATYPAAGSQAGPAASYATGPATAYPSGPATAYPSAQVPSTPYRTGPAPAPTPPVRVGPQGPGAGVVGAVVGVALIVWAGVLVASRTFGYDGPVFLTAGAVAMMIFGLAIVIAGIRGRTSGGIGGLAIVGLVLLLPVAAVQSWTGNLPIAGGSAVGEVVAQPVTVAQAERGFSVGAGNIELDLTLVPLGQDTIDVPVAVGAGEATITLPRDGAWTAEIRVMAGQVIDRGREVQSSVLPIDPVVVESDAVREGAEPELYLRIGVGAGNVVLKEER